MVLNTHVHEHEECVPLQWVTIRGLILNLWTYYIKPTGEGCDGQSVDSRKRTLNREL